MPLIQWFARVFEDEQGVPDEVRICTVLLIVGYLSFCGFDLVWHKAHFDMAQFGTGAGLLLGGIGACFFGRGKN